MKTRMTRTLVLLGVMCVMVTYACAGEPTFATKPSAKVESKGIRVNFAVAAPCDVEVAVLDSKGQEVRHLAAGVVGSKKAATPLVPEKLRQSLLWDRKDDRGNPVAGTSFKVRVRLGLKSGGVRPILESKRGKSPSSHGGIITEPDREKPGLPGITLEEIKTKRGRAQARRWTYGWYLMVDKEDDRLYACHSRYELKWYRYKGATGKAELFDPSVLKKYKRVRGFFRLGPNGEIHINPLQKFTRDLEAIPPLTAAHQRKRCNRFDIQLWSRWRAGPFIEHWSSGNRSPEFGLDGRCYMYVCLSKPIAYIAVFDTWEKKRALKEGFQPWLCRSGKSGFGGHFACIRVDAKGKVYIATGGTPKGTVTPSTKDRRSWYYYPMKGEFGSIVKLNLDDRWLKDFKLPFGAPPEDPEELKKGMMWSSKTFARRIEKCYPGVMSWLSGGCVCMGGTIFDLDEYGRMYIPDAGRESLVVLDNEGNEVLRIKKTVAAGADAKGITYNVGWPHRVVCSRKAIYYGEDLSRRVMRVAIAYAAEETCEVK